MPFAAAAARRARRLLPGLLAVHGVAAALMGLLGIVHDVPWVAPTLLGAGAPVAVVLVIHAFLHRAARRDTVIVRVAFPMAIAGALMGLCQGVALGWLIVEGRGGLPLALVLAAAPLSTLMVLAAWHGAAGLHLSCLVTAGVGVAIGPPGLLLVFLPMAALAPVAMAIMLADRHAARGAARMRDRALDAQWRLAAYERDGRCWFWETDADGRLVRISPSFAESIGRDEASLIGQPLDTVLLTDRDEPTLATLLACERPFGDTIVRVDQADDGRRWRLTGQLLRDADGAVAGFGGIGTAMAGGAPDVDRWRFDPVTGLPNPSSLAGGIEALGAIPGTSRNPAALLLVALDGARGIEERMGFAAADTVARHAVMRLRGALGEGAMLYRIADHRFAVLMASAPPETELARLASDISWKLSRPFRVDGAQLGFEVAVGIAVGVARDLAPGALERRAGTALDAARAAGGHAHRFHRPDLGTPPERRAAMARDLDEAFGARGLEPVYRPLVCANAEAILALEAMVRWRYAPPSVFPGEGGIPSDADLDALLLSAASLEAARWPVHVRLVFRLSAERFADSAFPAIVADALSRSGLDPARLELDVSEHAILAEGDWQAAVQRLKDIGVRLAIGDFGSGYSALGYLSEAMFDRIRIDRALVSDALAADGHARDMVDAIISLADALGLDSLVEDVESAQELAAIRALGCSQIQGGVFGAPMPSQEAQARMVAIAAQEDDRAAPQRLRAPRVAMARSATLVYEDRPIAVRIRNLSSTGAQVEIGVPVPEGGEVLVETGAGAPLAATVRWWQDGRMGLAFHRRIDVDALLSAGGSGRAVA